MTRKTLLVLVVLVALATLPGSAQQINMSGQPIVKYVSMTVSSTQVGFSSSQLISTTGQQLTQCIGRLETDQVRVGVRDLINPTTTVGQLVNSGDIITVTGYDNIRRFLAIRVTLDANIKWFCTAATL